MCRIQSVLSLSFLAGCVTLASCAATRQRPQAANASTDLHEISSLYEQVTSHHRRQFRRTVQDPQARNMRLLAEKTELLLASTADWESDARLAGADAADKNAARLKVRSFRSALVGLRDAASRGDMNALDDRYAAVVASYRDISSAVTAAD